MRSIVATVVLFALATPAAACPPGGWQWANQQSWGVPPWQQPWGGGGWGAPQSFAAPQQFGWPGGGWGSPQWGGWDRPPWDFPQRRDLSFQFDRPGGGR